MKIGNTTSRQIIGYETLENRNLNQITLQGMIIDKFNQKHCKDIVELDNLFAKLRDKHSLASFHVHHT